MNTTTSKISRIQIYNIFNKFQHKNQPAAMIEFKTGFLSVIVRYGEEPDSEALLTNASRKLNEKSNWK